MVVNMKRIVGILNKPKEVAMTTAILAFYEKSSGRVYATHVSSDGNPEHMNKVLRLAKRKSEVIKLINKGGEPGFKHLWVEKNEIKYELWEMPIAIRGFVFKSLYEMFTKTLHFGDHYYIFGVNGEKWEHVKKSGFRDTFSKQLYPGKEG
jgi:hypothetical protein